MTAPDLRLELECERPLDLRLTLSPLRRGGQDPTMRLTATEAWRATVTAEGPATVRLVRTPSGVTVEAWGRGSGWAVAHAPGLLGEDDDPAGFTPPSPLREAWRRQQGLRIIRTGAVTEALVASVLEQKVIGLQAWASHAAMVRSLGEPAPGPAPGLMLPPTPERLGETPYWAFHRWGVERRRADTVRAVARAASRLDEAVDLAPEAARQRLRAVPGVGEWTAAEVALVALGDADAVPVGDFHLANLVCWALAGRARGTDAEMLTLLEPHRGHRGRLIRHLVAAGIRAPRFGPRLPFVHIAHR